MSDAARTGVGGVLCCSNGEDADADDAEDDEEKAANLAKVEAAAGWIQAFFARGAEVPGLAKEYPGWKTQFVEIAAVPVDEQQAALTSMQRSYASNESMELAPLEFLMEFTKAAWMQNGGLEADEEEYTATHQSQPQQYAAAVYPSQPPQPPGPQPPKAPQPSQAPRPPQAPQPPGPSLAERQKAAVSHPDLCLYRTSV
jgi:hypothetical protein